MEVRGAFFWKEARKRIEVPKDMGVTVDLGGPFGLAAVAFTLVGGHDCFVFGGFWDKVGRINRAGEVWEKNTIWKGSRGDDVRNKIIMMNNSASSRSEPFGHFQSPTPPHKFLIRTTTHLLCGCRRKEK